MDIYPHNVTMFAPAAANSGVTSDGVMAGGRIMQHTLKASIDCVGIGLHSGVRVAMTLRAAGAGHGIVFRRRDLGIDIPARYDLVTDTRLCTVLAHPAIAEARIGTVEHVMAALAATGVTNVVVEVDGPEVPILDGSAANFVFLIDCAGVVAQDQVQSAIVVTRPVRVDGAHGAYTELLPPAAGGVGLDARIAIDFDVPAIGAQSLALQINGASFRRQLAAARTFTLLGEVEAMQAAGLALGGSLDNAVVVDGEKVLNPAGLRMPGEFVRHKLLDMVGDLALAGAVLHAGLRANRPGHTLNNQVVRKLFADPANWRLVDGLAPVESGSPQRAASG